MSFDYSGFSSAFDISPPVSPSETGVVPYLPIEASSGEFSVLRYVTGISGWTSAGWIIPNVQVEAPTQALSTHQEEIFDITSQAIAVDTSSNHSGPFSTEQTVLFSYLRDANIIVSGQSALSSSIIKRFTQSYFGGRL